jgi:hypothetical protein
MTEENKTFALVQNNLIVNTFIWDGQVGLDLQGEIVEIPSDSATGIGWTWDGTKFTDNRPKSPLGL